MWMTSLEEDNMQTKTSVARPAQVPQVPQAIRSEQAVLGALLIDPEAILAVSGTLRPEHFYLQKHRWIYEAALALHQRGEPLDYLTICTELDRRGQIEQVGGGAFVLELIGITPSAINVESYAAEVMDSAMRRAMLDVATKVAQLAYDGEQSIATALDEIERRLLQLRQGQDADLRKFDVLAADSWSELQAARAGERVLMASGYSDLDMLIGGFGKTDLWVVAARPGIGKSALLVNIATLCAIRGVRVGMFSLEMSAAQVFERTLVNQGYATALELRSGKVHPEHWQKVADGFGIHADLPIWVDDTASLSIQALHSKALRLQLQHGVDLLCVDYIQLLTAEGGFQRNRQQEIGQVTRGLKALAKDLRCPIIAAAQLNRNAEGARPTLADLREAGDIENDADGVIFINRERECAAGTVCPADLIVAKHRHGQTGTVSVGWIGDRMAFVPKVRERER